MNRSLQSSMKNLALSRSGASYSKGFSLHWGIARFSSVSEVTPDKCHFPTCAAAEGFSGRTLAACLEEPKSYASLLPICCRASWFEFVKNVHSLFSLTDYHWLGLFKMLVELTIPSEWCFRFEKLGCMLSVAAKEHTSVIFAGVIKSAVNPTQTRQCLPQTWVCLAWEWLFPQMLSNSTAWMKLSVRLSVQSSVSSMHTVCLVWSCQECWRQSYLTVLINHQVMLCIPRMLFCIAPMGLWMW